MGKRHIERICQNCQLFNAEKSQCSVVILHEGKRINLPVLAKDPCFFEMGYFDPTTKAVEDFTEDIKQVRFWVEDENGKPTKGNGTVKMEYPEGFFGKSTEESLGLDEDEELLMYLKVLEDSKKPFAGLGKKNQKPVKRQSKTPSDKKKIR